MKRSHRGILAAYSKQLFVRDCVDCGYAHLDPLPQAVEKYYENDRFYREHSSIDFLHKDIIEYKKGFWDAAFGYQIRLLGNLPIIDVGAGTGQFVDYWEKHCYYEAIGIEPSKLARTLWIASENSMYSELDKIPPIIDQDINIRMALVLEHIDKPEHFIRQYADIMNGGRMMIIVPNEFSPLQKRIGHFHWVSKVHCNYFTPTSLTNLLEGLGMRVIHKSATFPMELFILAGIDYRNNDVLGKRVHKIRLNFEKQFGVSAFRLYKLLFDKFGWGRELIFVVENA